MNILLAHPGTQHSPRLAQALYKRNSLFRYCTSLSLGDGTLLWHFLPDGLAARRRITGIPASKLSIQPWLEAAPWMTRMGMNSRKVYLARNKQFQRGISSHLIGQSDGIIGFDTSSWILARRASDMEKKFFVEMTTPHPAEKERIMESLRCRYPEWLPEGRTSAERSVEDLEASLASHVVVPSSYTRQSYIMSGVPQEKISVNPYGVNLDDFGLKRYSAGKKIRFLFLGAINANKGVPFLLEAWKQADHGRAELLLAGGGEFPPGITMPAGVTILGRIGSDRRRELFYSCDVFICPSFYEGLALVQLEAAACGLPVIGTTSSGANDVLTEGSSAFVIEPGSISQLVEKINFFIDNPEAIEAMGTEAHNQVMPFSWQAYADRWLKLIGDSTS